MNPACRRLVASFLALILSLPARQAFGGPNSAQALRAGLEGTVEQELSAGLEEAVKVDAWISRLTAVSELLQQNGWIQSADAFAGPLQEAWRRLPHSNLAGDGEKPVDAERRFLRRRALLRDFIRWLEITSQGSTAADRVKLLRKDRFKNPDGYVEKTLLEIRSSDRPAPFWVHEDIVRNRLGPKLSLTFIQRIGTDPQPVLLGEIRIGKDRSLQDRAPLLHLDIDDPSRKAWVEHVDMAGAWGPIDPPDLDQFNHFLGFMGSGLSRIPLASKPAPAEPSDFSHEEFLRQYPSQSRQIPRRADRIRLFPTSYTLVHLYSAGGITEELDRLLNQPRTGPLSLLEFRTQWIPARLTDTRRPAVIVNPDLVALPSRVVVPRIPKTLSKLALLALFGKEEGPRRQLLASWILETNEGPRLALATAPARITAGLEEPRGTVGEKLWDMTGEFLGSHPFQLRAWTGPENDRAQLFLYGHGANARILTEASSLRAIPLGAQHRMKAAGVSPAFLLQTLATGLSVPSKDLLLFAGLPDELFQRQVESFSAAQKPAVLLTLLRQFRGYLQEAYPVNPIQSFQVAMAYLKNDGDYLALVENINRALKNPRGNPRRLALPGIRNVSEIVSVDLWSVKEGNVTTVYQVEVALKNRAEKVRFVLNVAKDASEATEAVETAWGTLNSLHESDPEHVMEPFLFGLLELGLGQEKRPPRKTIAVLSGEWVEGDELHLHIQPDGQADLRAWMHQRSPGESLPTDQAERVWEEMTRLQVRHSSLIWADGGTSPMIQHALIALNAGDLVRYLKQDGTFGVLLIWPRVLPEATEASELLVRSLLISAIDQESSASSRQSFWGQPKRALLIVQQEFFEKFRAIARVIGIPEEDAFARGFWNQIVADALSRLIPAYLAHPELFISMQPFTDAEKAQTLE